jgi:hypothetical protein
MYTLIGSALVLAYLYFCLRHISAHDEQSQGHVSAEGQESNQFEPATRTEDYWLEGTFPAEYSRVWQNLFAPTMEPHHFGKETLYSQIASALHSDLENARPSTPRNLEGYLRLRQASSSAQPPRRRSITRQAVN